SWAERAGRVGSTALAAPVVAAPPAFAGAGLVAALLATFAAVDADRLVGAAFFGALLLSALPSGLVAGFAVALAALGRLAAGALFAGFAGFVGGAVRAFVAPVLPVAVLPAVAVLAFSPSPAFADAVFEAPAFAAAVFAVAGLAADDFAAAVFALVFAAAALLADGAFVAFTDVSALTDVSAAFADLPPFACAPALTPFVVVCAGMASFEAFRTAPARSAMAVPHIQNGRTAGSRAH